MTGSAKQAAPVALSIGDASNKGAVTKSEEMTFAAFAERFLALTPRLGKLPLKEYLELRARSKDDAVDPKERKRAKALVDREKAGKWYVPAEFKAGRRHSDSFVRAGVATLDFDAGTVTKGVLTDTLKGLAAFAFSTYSHGPAPMWRVHVALSEPTTSREQHAAVVRAIHSRFGPAHPVDERSFLPEQFWWQPSCPPDAVKRRETLRLEGAPFDVAAVAFSAAEAPEASAEPSQTVAEGDPERRAEVARLLGKINLAEAVAKFSDAEQAATPVSNRGAWVKIGTAAKDHEPAAFAEFLDWSRAEPGYDGDDDCEQQWASFGKRRKGPRATIATLYWLAGERSSPIATEGDFELVEKNPGDANPLEELNRRYFTALVKGKQIICREEDDGALTYMERDHFSSWHAHQGVTLNVATPDGGKKKVRKGLGAAWLTWSGQRRYERIVLAPDGNTRPGEYNLWRGFEVTPKAGDWSRFKHHIRDIICAGNAPEFEWVLSWLARLVQHPAEHAHVAIVLIGDEGTGKGKFAEWVGALVPRNFVHASDPQHVVGRFNARLESCLVLFLDEALFAGSAAEADRLKRIITEKTLTVEEKFLPAHEVPNRLHTIIASNHEHVIRAGLNARRFAVFNVSDARRQDSAYFAAIDRQMKNGGLAAMLHELLARDLSNFDPRKAPATEGLTEQKVASLSGPAAWIFEHLWEGTAPSAALGFASAEWPTAEEMRLARRDAYNTFLEWHGKRRRSGSPESAEGFGRTVAAIFGPEALTRRRIEGDRVQLYVLPRLAEAREAFNQWLGGAPLNFPNASDGEQSSVQSGQARPGRTLATQPHESKGESASVQGVHGKTGSNFSPNTLTATSPIPLCFEDLL